MPSQTNNIRLKWGMMDVYALRHGKAEERTLSVKSDSRRKLTESGKKELRCISKAIKSMDVGFDCIFSSPLLRARQTAEIIHSQVKCKKSIVFWDELKPEFDTNKIIQRLSTLKPDSSVLLVGHEPVLSRLVGIVISSNDCPVSITLKKGGFAHVQCHVQDSKISGTLRSIMTPRQLRILCK